MFRCILVALVVAASISTAAAVDILNPDNGHYYRTASPRSATWEAANLYAFQQVRDGMRGHLVTITSAAEQQFLMANYGAGGTYWTGGYQPPGSPEPGGNWQWVTGEPFEYSNWYAAGEPNNALGNEFVIELFSPSGGWNDTHLGKVEPWFPQLFDKQWIVEFTPGYTPVLDGSAFLLWQRSVGRGGFSPADFDGDLRVDSDDLALWKEYSGDGPQPPASVPEPATVVIALTGLLAMSALRRST
jgi:hypothetical protein